MYQSDKGMFGVLCIGLLYSVVEVSRADGFYGGGDGSVEGTEPDETDVDYLKTRLTAIKRKTGIPRNRSSYYENQQSFYKLQHVLYDNQRKLHKSHLKTLVDQPFLEDNATFPVEQLKYHSSSADYHRKQIGLADQQTQVHASYANFLFDHVKPPPVTDPRNATSHSDHVIEYHRNRMAFFKNQSDYHASIMGVHEGQIPNHKEQHLHYRNTRNQMHRPLDPQGNFQAMFSQYVNELVFHGQQIELHTKQRAFHDIEIDLNRDQADTHEYQMLLLKNKTLDLGDLAGERDRHHKRCLDIISFHDDQIQYLKDRAAFHKAQFVLHASQDSLRQFFANATPDVVIGADQESTTPYFDKRTPYAY